LHAFNFVKGQLVTYCLLPVLHHFPTPENIVDFLMRHGREGDGASEQPGTGDGVPWPEEETFAVELGMG
jgi:hypothetical protein